MPRPTERRNPGARRRGRTWPFLAAAAAGLAASALHAQREALRAERENPPTGRFVEVDGVRLHHVERGGGGTPVVFLHGNGAMIQDFASSGLLDLASPRHRVFAFDRPGFGHSERPRNRLWTPAAQAELLRGAFARLGIERPVVAGHSWGALVALALGIAHPDAVRSLVLLSGYYFPTARADLPLFTPPAIPVVGDALRYTASPLIGRVIAPRVIRRIFEPCPVPPRFTAEFPLGLALRPSQIRAIAEDTAFLVPAAAALQGCYADLRLPVVILCGDEDRIVDPEQSARLAATIPAAQLRVLPGLGHMIHHFAQGTIVEAIAAATGSQV
jgi:pimeloyl-ACP methyl ester carboxylesterase